MTTRGTGDRKRKPDSLMNELFIIFLIYAFPTLLGVLYLLSK